MLDLCESQKVLPPHTFQWASDDFHSVNPVKFPSPSVSAGNTVCCLWMIDFFFLVEWSANSLVLWSKVWNLNSLALEWWWWPWVCLCPCNVLGSQTSRKGRALNQGDDYPSCTWQWLGLTPCVLFKKLQRFFFCAESGFVMFYCGQSCSKVSGGIVSTAWKFFKFTLSSQ